MNASIDTTKKIIVLTPTDAAEGNCLRALIAGGAGSSLRYKGRSGAHPNDPYNLRMLLRFELDDYHIVVMASTDDGECDIRAIRDAVYFGGGGLTLLNHEEVDGKPSAQVCVTFCKHCQAPLIDMGRCEWKTCEACVDKCEHEYQEGATHGGPAGTLAVSAYCKKCGRGNPNATVDPIIP